MEALFTKLRRIARAHCTVLLGGETGTGKELVARAIHAESPRRRAPFQAVNCATFSPTLPEPDLFGHVHAPFTGAGRDTQGLFALPHPGPPLLHRVARLPLDRKANLWRA